MHPRHKEFVQGFLYSLMRDHVEPEKVAALVEAIQRQPPPYVFPDQALGDFAGALAERLLTDEEASRVNRENFEKALAASREVCRKIATGEYKEEERVAVREGCRVYWVKRSELSAVLMGGATLA
jgi:hypothetical protein